jgi:hypothetical protein
MYDAYPPKSKVNGVVPRSTRRRVEALCPQPHNQFRSAWKVPDIIDALPGEQCHLGDRSSKIAQW